MALVLHGLFKQSLPASQIVIADDGSTSDTKVVIDRWRTWGLPVRHCWHEDKGFRKTVIMNQALSLVSSDLTIFLDGDCIPSRDFVRDHCQLTTSGSVCAGPRILSDQRLTSELESSEPDPQSKTWFDRSLWAKASDLLTRKVNRLGPLVRLPDGFWRRCQPDRWQLVRGCNFSAPTGAIIAAGGFEEAMTGWGLEDSELAVRLINNGLTIKNTRYACAVLHLWHKSESRERFNKNQLLLDTAIKAVKTRAIQGIKAKA